MAEKDPMNPSYYKSASGLESVDILEAFLLDKPYRWAPVKYLLRAGRKSGQDEIQDLRKAIWWINREITSIEKGNAKDNPPMSESRYIRLSAIKSTDDAEVAVPHFCDSPVSRSL